MALHYCTTASSSPKSLSEIFPYSLQLITSAAFCLRKLSSSSRLDDLTSLRSKPINVRNGNYFVANHTKRVSQRLLWPGDIIGFIRSSKALMAIN